MSESGRGPGLFSGSCDNSYGSYIYGNLRRSVSKTNTNKDVAS